MSAVGIMQGRLSPAPAGRAQVFPFETWRSEFAAAAVAGIGFIEWLVTADGFDENPLLARDGAAAIRALIDAHGVRVNTLCADFLIHEPLVRVEAARRAASLCRLSDVVDRSLDIGASVIVVPLLEEGEIRNRDEAAEVAECLQPIARAARASGQRIAIECLLPIDDLCDLVSRCGSPSIGVCYDAGNGASMGFDAGRDIRRLGAALFEMHMKDRRRGGPSVPLGSGEVDFADVFHALGEIGFTGPITLETPVGDDPLASAVRHVTFVRHHARHAVLAPR